MCLFVVPAGRLFQEEISEFLYSQLSHPEHGSEGTERINNVSLFYYIQDKNSWRVLLTSLGFTTFQIAFPWSLHICFLPSPLLQGTTLLLKAMHGLVFSSIFNYRNLYSPLHCSEVFCSGVANLPLVSPKFFQSWFCLFLFILFDCGIYLHQTSEL